MTHFLPYDYPTRDRGREQRTLCGVWAVPWRDHRADPDCPVCVRLIAEDDANVAATTGEPVEQFESPDHEAAARRAGVLR